MNKHAAAVMQQAGSVAPQHSAHGQTQRALERLATSAHARALRGEGKGAGTGAGVGAGCGVAHLLRLLVLGSMRSILHR